MQVVLLERIVKLGQMGDVVTVKDGYARNFLLPQNKALRATEANLKRFENERAEIEARDLARKQEAEAVKSKLDGQQFVILRQSGATGQLYGSVSSRDIVQILAETDIRVSRGQITLDAVKTLGIHAAQIALHADVQCTITLNVARTEEEASRQAAGEVVVGDSETADPTPDPIIAAEEVFEAGHEVDLTAEQAEQEATLEETPETPDTPEPEAPPPDTPEPETPSDDADKS